MADSLHSIEARPVLTEGTIPAQGGNFDARDKNDDRVSRQSFPTINAASPENSDPDSGRAASASQTGDTLNLSPEAQSKLRELRQRDAVVRAHEQAHISSAGAYAVGGANYEYQKGPDGKQYAIGGHVDIDTSSVPGNPRATREKARQIHRAALAPGEPSAKDQQVAAEAASLEVEAQSQIQEQNSNASAANVSDVDEGVPAGGAMPAEYGKRRRAANVYETVAAQVSMPVALAPYGTGISLTV